MKRKYRYISSKKILKVRIPKEKFCKGLGSNKGKCKLKPDKKNRLGLCPDCMKERILMKFMRTRGGTQRLAEAMALPIRRSLDLQSVARRAFSVQPLPESAISYAIHNPRAITAATN